MTCIEAWHEALLFYLQYRAHEYSHSRCERRYVRSAMMQTAVGVTACSVLSASLEWRCMHLLMTDRLRLNYHMHHKETQLWNSFVICYSFGQAAPVARTVSHTQNGRNSRPWFFGMQVYAVYGTGLVKEWSPMHPVGAFPVCCRKWDLHVCFVWVTCRHHIIHILGVVRPDSIEKKKPLPLPTPSSNEFSWIWITDLNGFK